MGPFIIGVLVGWLAEWVFFTFFIKGKDQSKNNANASALQKELNAKNNEIKALQVKLADSGTSSDMASSSEATASAVSTSSSTTRAKKPASEPKAKTTAPKSDAKEPVTKAPAKAKPKTEAKKPVAKKAPAKTTAKKPAAKAKKKLTGDDFTLLSGIGPSMATTLNELGIDSFKKLADMDDDILRDMLESSGARLNNNKEAMDTWNEQATLADKGDLEGLKKMQEALKN